MTVGPTSGEETTSRSGLTAVSGLLVGHWTDAEACTGCTIVLCPQGATAGVAVLGGAPGTRETDLLCPGFLVDRIHGVLLTGGSAFGLAAAEGAMRWLEERGVGRTTGAGVVPIVVGAVVYDLNLGRSDVRPGPEEGYKACQAANGEAVVEGSVGAGTGATVGKALGMAHATKGGIGTACEEGPRGVRVAALVVVNAFGEVVDPDSGQVLAGVRARGGGYLTTLEVLREGRGISPLGPPNSTIGVVATDAPLDKAACSRLSTMAMAGMARAVRPAWTQVDGDVLFGLSTGTGPPADLTVLGSLAARAVERAIVRAVLMATSLGGVPASSQWPR